MTTGSIPTFIDISSNFASPEIDEDNIIDQMINRGRKVVFAGDDTWLSLFPNRFTRTYPYPSFDVWDLDTVDRGVEKHLFQVSPTFGLFIHTTTLPEKMSKSKIC